MNNQNQEKKWEEHLEDIGVTNLSNPDEIASKIIKVEKENPEYAEQIMKSLYEVLEEENLE